MFRYDLHIHSREGSACSQTDIHAMIRRYKELGFAGAVITNHFLHGNTSIDRNLPWRDLVTAYCKAYTDGIKTAKKLDFDLLFGIEEGYGEGKEFLVYGITPDFLYDHPCLRTADLTVWSQLVREAGGFIAYAHPFRKRPHILNSHRIPDISLIDGVECYNFCNTPEENEKVLQVFSSKDVILIAGGDQHTNRFTTTFGIKTPKRVFDEKALITMLKRRQFSLYLGE